MLLRSARVVCLLVLSFAGCDQAEPTRDRSASEYTASNPHAAASRSADSVSFAVIGDQGCGCPAQRLVAERLSDWHNREPFDIVLTTGDNIYGHDFYRGFYFFRYRGGDKNLFASRFDRSYDALRARGVKFYATLGNHDYETNQAAEVIADKARFNITGQHGYYSFSPAGRSELITFFALNSVRLVGEDDPYQVQWLQKGLHKSKSRWKIVYFHHPIYTAPGKHRSSETFLKSIEPILVQGGVRLTFAGHNHFYARIKPQHGITHFTTGGGGEALKTPRESEITAKVSRSYHFIYVDVFPDRLKFWAVAASGPVIDSGVISRQ